MGHQPGQFLFETVALVLPGELDFKQLVTALYSNQNRVVTAAQPSPHLAQAQA
jgi:hypothetical protein